MSNRNPVALGIGAVALVVVYSIIMMATDGTAGSWAWILLVGVVALLAIAARTVTRVKAER